MREASPLALLRDPRLAGLAVGAAPAWLWRTDGAHVLWANAAGVVALGATTLSELTEWQFAPNEPAAAEVIRLAATLERTGIARLERLRGFGDGLSGMLVCACSHIALADKTPAILIAATLQMRRELPLTARIRTLFDDCDDAIVVFSSDGMLLYANAPGKARLKEARSIGALGAGALAEAALGSGSSRGESLFGPVELTRLGVSPEVAVLVRFGDAAANAHATERAAATVTPEHGAPEAPSTFESAPVPPDMPAPDEQTPVAPALPPAPEIAPDRRHPLRFVWQMDAAGAFTIDSDEFVALVGGETAGLLGRGFEVINATLGLDPARLIARAIATRDTWSGITLAWPAEGDTVPLRTEMSGLPVFDRDREFLGYRGFGVCRDVVQLAALARMRRTQQTDNAAAVPRRAAEPAQRGASQDADIMPPAPNVVPFRAPSTADARSPELSPGERTIFSEIARRLSARLKNDEPPRPAAPGPIAPGPIAPGSIAPGSTPPTPSAASPVAGGLAPPGVSVLRAAAGPGIDGRKLDVAKSRADSEPAPAWLAPDNDARKLIDRLPVGVLIYRLDALVYANQAFLDCVGCGDLAALTQRGGLDSLYVEIAPGSHDDTRGRALTIKTEIAPQGRIAGRLFSVPWGDTHADVLVLNAPTQQHDNTSDVAKPLQPPPEKTTPCRETADAPHPSSRIEAKAAERANLLAMISHEVRTPLTTIVGFAETMLDERFGLIGNERYRKYLHDIRAASANILGLFDNVVSLSSVESVADKSTLSADINATVQDCATRMQADASRARVLIRTSLGQPMPRAAAAPDAARQIVHILLANSIRFAGAGSQVIISTATAPGKIILRLRDTGAGLNADELAATLRPPEATEQRAHTADGSLSFAVARTLAEANAATIAVSSKPDEGTLVEVIFAARSDTAP